MHEFESFRALRAQLVTRLEKVGNGAKVLAVLSPMNGEGKSTVAINVAKVLAMEGRRVLVFDADMRRPTMRSAFAPGEGPGLEDVLKGTATLEQAVRPSRIRGVDVLGVKEGTNSAAELASSPHYAEAIRTAREKYDIVIVDSAPVNQVSESSLIARRADAAFLVMRDGQTGRGSAHEAKKRLEGMDVKVLGAVLNCAIPHGSGYGYGYGYGYYYYGRARAKA